MKPTRWEVIEGRRASTQLDNGKYVDVTINEFLRGGKVKVEMEDGGVQTIHVSLLERPMTADVNERFNYFSSLTTLIIQKRLKSLFITGEGGVGKGHTVDERLMLEDARNWDDLKDDEIRGKSKLEVRDMYDYVKIKGYTTPRSLFDTLEEHHDKVVILDDCDSALTDTNAANILKAALDTYDRRIVQWRTAREQAQFEFTGAVIFLSNRNRDKVPQAIISRSVVVDLFMTNPEKIERMGYILPSLTCVSMEMEKRFDVLRLIDKYKDTLQDLNLRTLIKSLIVYENTDDMELVRYQILNG